MGNGDSIPEACAPAYTMKHDVESWYKNIKKSMKSVRRHVVYKGNVSNVGVHWSEFL